MCGSCSLVCVLSPPPPMQRVSATVFVYGGRTEAGKLGAERARGVAQATQPFSGRGHTASHTGGGGWGQKSQARRQQGKLASWLHLWAVTTSHQALFRALWEIRHEFNSLLPQMQELPLDLYKNPFSLCQSSEPSPLLATKPPQLRGRLCVKYCSNAVNGSESSREVCRRGSLSS